MGYHSYLSLAPPPQLFSPHCYQPCICIQTRGLWSTYGVGFRVGFSRRCPWQALYHNHPLASQHPEVVWKHIRSDLQRGSLVGPLHMSLAAQVHTSPIGLVPKSQSDRWRWIFLYQMGPASMMVAPCCYQLVAPWC